MACCRRADEGVRSPSDNVPKPQTLNMMKGKRGKAREGRTLLAADAPGTRGEDGSGSARRSSSSQHGSPSGFGLKVSGSDRPGRPRERLPALNTKCSFVCKFIQGAEMPEKGVGGKILPGFARIFPVSQGIRRKKIPGSSRNRGTFSLVAGVGFEPTTFRL